MIIANKELLDDFVQSHANAAKPLNNWVEIVKAARWHSHVDLKKTFPSADYVKNGPAMCSILEAIISVLWLWSSLSEK